MGRLTRLIKCTTGEAQELVKHFINDKPEQGYRNAMELLKRQYGNPHRLLAAYRMEIKHMSPIKPGDILAFRKLFNFLIKCQPLSRSSWNNPLDTPEIICMILSKLPVHLPPRQMEQEHSEDEKNAFQGTSAVWFGKFLGENYAMDVLKKSPRSIMKNFMQTEEYARYAMANIQQHFMDMLERKSKMIIKRMIVQMHQMGFMWNVSQLTLVEMW